MAIVLDGQRTERKKTRSSARFRASWPDCLGEEEEGGEAELLVRFDLLQEACVNGGVWRQLGQLAVMTALGLGLLHEGKRRGRRSSTSWGASLSSMGGQGAREQRWRPRWGAAMATVATLWHQEEGADSGDPLSGICSFSLFQKFQ